MPRVNVITDEGLFKQNLEEYQRRAGDYNLKYDVCRVCAHTLDMSKLARLSGISLSWAMDTSGDNVLGPDHQPIWEEHPPYGGAGYECLQCGRELGGIDDPDPRQRVVVKL